MSTANFLQWVNGFEMIVSFAVILLLVRFIFHRAKTIGGFFSRLRQVLRRDFQGGEYDLAVALTILIVGKAIRAAAVWEWRHFGGELDFFFMSLGIMIVGIGMLCTLRVLSPASRFNVYSVLVTLAAAAFATASVYYL